MEMSPTARDSVDAFVVANDQIARGTGERNTHPETLSRGGLAEAAVGITADYAETHRRSIANGGKANCEARSHYPL